MLSRYSFSAPTFGSIAMRLSFRITSRSVFAAPALLSPSKASPPGQRAVADHGDHLALLAPQSRRGGHAQRGGDRSRSVSRAERVVLAFAHARETAQPVQLAIRQEPVAPTRDDLVGISLMAHVPDQLVVRRIERRSERGGQLDDPQTRPQMPRIGRKRSMMKCRSSPQ